MSGLFIGSIEREIPSSANYRLTVSLAPQAGFEQGPLLLCGFCKGERPQYSDLSSQRQAQAETRSALNRVVHPEIAAVRQHGLAGEGEPQPEAVLA